MGVDQPDRRTAVRILAAFVTVLVAAVGPVWPQSVAAAPAGTPHYPDLVSTIPLNEFSVVQTSPSTRDFRYTHVISNLGDGPLELRPTYDASTDTATAVQRVYTHNAAGTWSTAADLPVVGRFIYHPPHGHYHFPLAEFGLYQVDADGSRGGPVSVSPKVGFCIADSVTVNGALPHYGAFTYPGACGDPTATMGISVGMGDFYDYLNAGQSIDATSVGDGEYWFHSVVDPWNYLRESNEGNNITDVGLASLAGHPRLNPQLGPLTFTLRPGKTTCVVPGCGRKGVAGEYCSAHAQRLRRYGDVRADVPVRITSPRSEHCIEVGCREPA
jgi:hypothetical protein